MPTKIDPASLILGAAQTGLGIIQDINAQKDIKNLKKQRKAYQTPEEIFKVLQATENRAQQGFDAQTLDYLTNQTDRAFDSVLGTATRLGADPNDLSAAFDQKMQGIMKIGAQNQALNMETFNRYLGAMDTVAANKAAEQKSQQDLIRDDLQAASGNKAAGLQNIAGGINTYIAGQASADMKQLFKDNKTFTKDVSEFVGEGLNPVLGGAVGTGGVGGGGTADSATPSMTADNYALLQQWFESQKPNLNRR